MQIQAFAFYFFSGIGMDEPNTSLQASSSLGCVFM
jgi:hypothetical protein